jgi:hypothetical protein
MSENRKTYRLDKDVNKIVQARKEASYGTENEVVNNLIRETTKIAVKDLRIRELESQVRGLKEELQSVLNREKEFDKALSLVVCRVIDSLPKPDQEPAPAGPPGK